ncbi:MAG: helix-turn-helix transcriptional regulator [Sphingobium sp.]|nr:helix-turn-helix transcriptional regulator [Sphingobium sp.]
MDTEEENLCTCPVDRALTLVGDRWSMLVLRDLDRGLTRYDQLRTSLGIAPNILASRLAALTQAGLLEKRQYSARPPRFEYVLTDSGRDFIPALAVLGAWGRKHRGGGTLSRLIDAETGVEIEPVVIDAVSGAPIGTRPLALVMPE